MVSPATPAGALPPKPPVVWWARNDLRLSDNPVLRRSIGEAFADQRPWLAVVVLDPRFLNFSTYGRVTDPLGRHGIRGRKPVAFGSRKCGGRRAHFWLQSIWALADSLAQHGQQLLVLHGTPEDLFAAFPAGTLVLCQQEPVSVEATDVEEAVAAALGRGGGRLWRCWGAMGLYHWRDLPFFPQYDTPTSYTGLAEALGWRDVWHSAERDAGAAAIRAPVPNPAAFPAPFDPAGVPGRLDPAVLRDDRKAMQELGYSREEVDEALVEEEASPGGGEAEARAVWVAWLAAEGQGSTVSKMAAAWDLPVARNHGAADGPDPLAWANLSSPSGWTRLSAYLALGCLTARSMVAEAAHSRCLAGLCHRLLWREWHRLNAIRWGRRLFWLQGPGRVERPWSTAPALVAAWKAGATGVPYVDACMRELRRTGWLAYKGRKTVAHFLVFDLGVDWRLGAFHFEEVLLDYDCAMNYGNWVTVARVDRSGGWAPAVHAELLRKLAAEEANDPEAAYIRRWVPELGNAPGGVAHAPWRLSDPERAELIPMYPAPIVPLHLEPVATLFEPC
eukprot:EG_transcript_6288